MRSTAATRRSKTSISRSVPSASRRRQVGVADRSLDGRAVGDAAEPADDLAIEADGLAAVDGLVVGAADDEGPEASIRSGGVRRDERVAPDERALLEPDEGAETGLERGVEHRQVGAVVAVALLHAQGVEGSVADGLEAARRRGAQAIPDGDGPFDGRRRAPSRARRRS